MINNDTKGQKGWAEFTTDLGSGLAIHQRKKLGTFSISSWAAVRRLAYPLPPAVQSRRPSYLKKVECPGFVSSDPTLQLWPCCQVQSDYGRLYAWIR